MSCYFIATIYTDNPQAQTEYLEYIRLVKPIVERHSGTYLVRSEELTALSDAWRPNRIIVIQFPDREHLDRCFQSPEYKEIARKRENSVDSRAVIVEGLRKEEQTG
ncbi:DUF1330 domain-containing protein [Clostridium sp. chh4-2]|uniref:DUF1330 domain-containing protein n=1 Tax=Clostridium sp. chh4-2 TaxID=2067550 RepID=UPI000CCFB780|nr:DUF1330 domain-containing protein [Clostridium sp. chh4-2]PNV62397.1 DUF1330 domain-containing protein [Clostridium sp. chh4-2]